MTESAVYTNIEVTLDGAIGRLTLNRPAKLNPLSAETLVEIAAAADWFNKQEAAKVVIVSGHGRAFSAGADLSTFGNPDALSRRASADKGRLMADALENMRPLAIAAIHGWCIGGGVVLAAACDLRLAAVETRFKIPEVELGIPLAWGGIPRLVREFGPALTKELVITCREFGAEEAKAAGFLNRVVPEHLLQQEASALAECVAEKAMLPLSVTKRHTNAVTAQAIGIERSWSDADGIVSALSDPECVEARTRYLAARGH